MGVRGCTGCRDVRPAARLLLRSAQPSQLMPNTELHLACVYAGVPEAGMRVPLHGLFCEVLNHFGLAPVVIGRR